MSAKKNQIDLVIFDFAGTIVDHGVFAPIEALVRVFREQGVELSYEEARGPMGIHKKDHIRALLELESIKKRWFAVNNSAPGEESVEILYSRMAEIQPDLIIEYNAPIDGLKKTFEYLRKNGIRIGGTTGYIRSMLDSALGDLKAKNIGPDYAVAADEIPAGRPAGYGCWKNAIELKAPFAYRCVKIGDTIPDILEGLNAGMWSVGVYESCNKVGLSEKGVKLLPGYPNSQVLLDAKNELLGAGAHECIPGVWAVEEVLEKISARIIRGERP